MDAVMQIRVTVQTRQALAQLALLQTQLNNVRRSSSTSGGGLFTSIAGGAGKAGAAIKGTLAPFNSFNGALMRGGTGFSSFGSHLKNSLGHLEKWGKNLQWTGRQLEFRITIPLLLAGRAATKFALENEAATTRLKKVYGDVGDSIGQFTAELGILDQAFTSLSNIYGVAKSEVIDIGATWAAAGAQGIALAKATRLTLDAMILGDMSYKQAADSLIVLKTQYGLTTDELKTQLAIVNAIENETAANFGDLITAIVRGGGVARTAGISIQHFGALVAALVPASGSAAQAGNALKTVISRLMAPTQQATEVMAAFGINTADASWQMQNGEQRILTLAKAYETLTPAQRALASATIASRFQVAKFDVLLRDVLDPLGMYQKALRATADDSKIMAQYTREIGKYLSSTPQAFKILTTQLQNAMSEIILPLLPAILAILSRVVRLVDAFTELSPAIQQLIVGGLAFLALLGPIISYIGVVGVLLAKLASSIAFVGKAVFFFGSLFYSSMLSIVAVAWNTAVGTAAALAWLVNVATTGLTALGWVMVAPFKLMVLISQTSWIRTAVIHALGWASVISTHLIAGARFVAMHVSFWAQTTGVDILNWARRIAGDAAAWIALRAGVVTGWAARHAANIAGWAVAYALDAGEWVANHALHAAQWAVSATIAAAGALGIDLVLIAAWARRRAMNVAQWASDIAMNLTVQATLLAQEAAIWARRVAADAAGWASRVAITVMGWTAIAIHDTIGWATQLAGTVASWARVRGVWALNVAGTLALNASFWALSLFADQIGWAARLAASVAGWAAVRASNVADWIAITLYDAVGWASRIAATVAGWTSIVAIHALGWGVVLTSNVIQAARWVAQEVILWGGILAIWAWGHATRLAGDAAAWVALRVEAAMGWAALHAVHMGGWLTARAIALAGSTITAIASTGWIGLLVAGIVGLGVLIGNNLGAVFAWIKSAISNLGDWFSGLVNWIAGAIGRLPEMFLNVFSNIVDIVKSAISAVADMFGSLFGMGGSGGKKKGAAKAKTASVPKGTTTTPKGAGSGGGASAPLAAPKTGAGGVGTPAGGGGGGAKAATSDPAWKGQLDAINKALDTEVKKLHELENAASSLKDKLREATSKMDELARTPIKGMQAMEEQIWQNEYAQKKLRLQMMLFSDAVGGIDKVKDHYAKLNGEIELLQGQKIDLRMGGAGSDVTGGLDKQIAALTAQKGDITKTVQEYDKMQEQLDQLAHVGERLDLMNQVKFDPLTHEIQKLIDTSKEMPFDQIKAGLIAQRAEVERLTDAYNKAETAVKNQKKVVQGLRDAKSAIVKAHPEAASSGSGAGSPSIEDQFSAAGAGNFATPGGTGGAGFTNEAGDLQALADQWKTESAGLFGNLDLFAPIKDSAKRAWEWIKDKGKGAINAIGDTFKGKSLTGGKDSGSRIGGAVVGGIIGAFAGPWGAVIGASIGAAFGPKVWDKIGGPIMRFVDGAIDLFKKLWKEVEPVFNAVGRALGSIMKELGNWGPTISRIFGVIKLIFGAFVLVILGVWNTLKGPIIAVIDFIGEAIRAGLEIVRGIIDTVCSLITGDWQGVWDGIMTILDGAWDLIFAVLRGIPKVLWALIKGIADTLWTVIKWGADKVWDIITGMVGWFIALPGRLISGIGDLGRAIWNGIKGGFSAFKNNIGDILNAIVDFFVKLPGRILGFAKTIGDAALEIGKKIIGGIGDGILGIGGFIKDIGTGLANALISAWNWVADKINEFVPDQIGWGPFKLDIPDNPIPKLNKLAKGGTVMARSGGIFANIGEAGRNEAVVPLPAGFTMAHLMKTLNRIEADRASSKSNAHGSQARELHFHGDLVFPNITSGDEAHDFIKNLEALAEA